MNRYSCHKEVTAGKILSIDPIPEPQYIRPVCKGCVQLGTNCGHCERCEYHRTRGPMGEGYMLSIEGDAENVVKRIVNKQWLAKHAPVVPGGYLVVYDDDYASFSPAAAFESGYTRI